MHSSFGIFILLAHNWHAEKNHMLSLGLLSIPISVIVMAMAIHHGSSG